MLLAQSASLVSVLVSEMIPFMLEEPQAPRCRVGGGGWVWCVLGPLLSSFQSPRLPEARQQAPSDTAQRCPPGGARRLARPLRGPASAALSLNSRPTRRLTGKARLQVGPAAGPSWAVFNFPSGKIALSPVFLTLKAQDLGGEEAPSPRPDQQGEKGPQLM